MTNLTLDTGKAISYGWESVKKDLWYFVGIAVVSVIISSIADNPGQRNNKDLYNVNFWSILTPFLTAWMVCGYTKLSLSYQSGKKLPFTDLFKQFKYFWRVLGATILVGLIVGLGLLLFIIPGIYFALRFQLTNTLIVDKNLGILEAMRQSSKLTEGIKLQLFGFNLTLLGVLILGLLALGVGIFVAIPVIWLAGVVVYRQISSQQPASLEIQSVQ
jgi:uncharacterized membrane protein